MTADLQLFLLQRGQYRHEHDYGMYDNNTGNYACACGKQTMRLPRSLFASLVGVRIECP